MIYFTFFDVFWVWGAVDKSAASAASPDSVKFQAVIKSAASTASPRGGHASGQKFKKKKAVIRSAASAASAKGGCASSRLDQGLKVGLFPIGILA